MLVKAADDRLPDIKALDGLMARPGLDPAIRSRIQAEVRQVQAGISGEREAAYEIDFYYGANPNRMVIHDLRLEVAGRVAQIDHVLIDRLMGIWILESKHFSEGVGVDEYGEWVGFFGRRPYGIGSPIEQNRKHAAVLADLFSSGLVELPRRLGVALKPDIKPLVLVSKNARISRPKTAKARDRVEGLDTVIKVDQLKRLLDKDLDSAGVRTMAKLVSRERIERLALDLATLHRPAKIDWAARFGLGAKPVEGGPVTEPVTPVAAASRACVNCSKPVSQAVADYCADHAELFSGRVLCLDCQRKARRGQI